MSHAGQTIKSGLKIFNALTAEKPHSSVTDWIEILTGDNYAEDELDAVSELVQAVDLQQEGPDEASRAIRKKMKYGSTHRQLRALTLLKSLSENSRTFPKSFATSPMLLDRLKETARDPHTDPRVRRKLLFVLLGWKKQHEEDGDRAFAKVAGLWAECGGQTKRASVQATSVSAQQPKATPASRDDGLWEHSWDVSPAAAAATQKATKEQEQHAKLELAARRADQARLQAEKDTKERERTALERRERDLAERERKLKLKEAAAASRATGSSKVNPPVMKTAKVKEPKRPPFNLSKEKPGIIMSIATASQCSNNLINALRHVNREKESILENLKVQDALEEAKLARRKIIRYIQLVEDEELTGTLLKSNEDIIAALQLYDKMSKPVEHDSDDERDPNKKQTDANAEAAAISLAALRLQHERESELAKLQAKQKAAVQRDQIRRQNSGQVPTGGGASAPAGGAYSDLAGLNFESGRSTLTQPPASYDPYGGSTDQASSHTLSDLSDYDSSDDDYQIHARSRRTSQSVGGAGDSSASRPYNTFGSLDDGGAGLLDTPSGADDPFADPFFSSQDGPVSPPTHERKEWTSV